MLCGATHYYPYAVSGLISVKQCSISSSIASSLLAIAQNLVWKAHTRKKGSLHMALQMRMHGLQMVELEETFITQLQRVADTYKREMQEQHGIRSDTEVQLRAAQLAVHQADTQKEEAQAALQALQVPTAAA